MRLLNLKHSYNSILWFAVLCGCLFLSGQTHAQQKPSKTVLIGIGQGIIYSGSPEMDAEIQPVAIYSNGAYTGLNCTCYDSQPLPEACVKLLHEHPKWSFYANGLYVNTAMLARADTEGGWGYKRALGNFWWDADSAQRNTFFVGYNYHKVYGNLMSCTFLGLSDSTGKSTLGDTLKRYVKISRDQEKIIFKTVAGEMLPGKELTENDSFTYFYSSKTDIDHDGIPEYLGSGRLKGKNGKVLSCLVMYHLKNEPVVSQVIPLVNKESAEPVYWNITGTMDIDGDGISELIGSLSYANSYGIAIYSYHGGRLQLETISERMR